MSSCDDLPHQMHNLTVEASVQSTEDSTMWTEGHRPDFGKSGIHLTVTTNHVELLQTPSELYEYHVEFGKVTASRNDGKYPSGRDITSRMEKMRVLEALKDLALLKDLCWAHSHDSSKIWFTKDGPKKKSFLDVTYKNGNGGIESLSQVTLYRGQKIAWHNTSKEVVGTAQEPRDLFERLLMLKAFLCHEATFDAGLTQVGPNRFFINNTAHNLNNVLEAKRGYHFEVHAAEAGILWNVNTATKAFYRTVRVSDLIVQLKRPDPFFLTAILKGLKVQITYALNGGNTDAESCPTKSITSFGLGTNEQRFFLDANDYEGRSVSEYLEETGRMTKLSHPSLPCVNVGADDKTKPHCAQWIPAEFLTILPNQPANEEFAQLALANMIKVAAKNADVNRDLISGEGLQTLGLANTDVLSTRGFRVDKELLNIPARILKTPSVAYGNSTLPVTESAWNLAKTRKFYRNGPISKLLVLCIFDAVDAAAMQSTAKKFAPLMVEQLKHHGFRLPGIDPFTLQGCDRRNTPELERTFARAASKGFTLLLVMLPDKDVFLYNRVKILATIKYGINTVCCTVDNAKRMDKQLASNLILRMNIKSGGVNQVAAPAEFAGLGVKPEDVIVMGAEVIHLGGKSGTNMHGCPSIASVLGSTDKVLATYLASMRLQRSRQERIENMGDMVEERLRAWMMNNPGRVPAAIVFYRDGVSDSQYNEIRETEIQAIFDAWNRIKEFCGTLPKLNFVIVSKRHQGRIYPTKDSFPKEHLSKFGNNVKPGICVDRAITHPYLFDFYLGAHAAIKGTMRPAHYIVLRNDLKLGADAMQKITHAFSYMHSICTRGTSYAAPAFAADQACEHGKIYLDYAMDYNAPRRREETEAAFYDRCLRRAITENDKWNQSGRPGPWHPNVDGVMFYL